MTSTTAASRRQMWLLFLLFQALYALTSSGNAFRVPDEFEVYYQTEHLVDSGDLSVPQTIPRNQFFGRFGVDGKPYAPYGPLGAFLAVPHHLLARAVVAMAGIPRDTMTWGFVVSGLTMWTTATGAALAVAGFYRAASVVGAGMPTAALLSILLGGASVLWPYGTSFYAEGWQAAALIWSAVFLLERRVLLAAVMLCGAGLIKVTGLALAPGLLAAVAVDRSISSEARRSALLALAGGIGVAVLVHAGWNFYRFGNPVEFGYEWSEMVPVLPARTFSLRDLPRGLVVLLLTPGKSVLLWAPLICLSLTRLRTCPRPIVIGAATSLICGLVFYGAYQFPEGGYAHGPRHLVPILPLLLLPAATPGPPWSRPSLAICATVGFALALMAVSISFLQDQSLGQKFTRERYYERIEPAPGRAWNRYRLGYVPFLDTIQSDGWPRPDVGTGLDFFWVHAWSAKSTIPEARRIPNWLIWGIPTLWGVVIGVTGTMIRRSRP